MDKEQEALKPAENQELDYTALLEKEYPNDRLVKAWRSDGMTDEEIYTTLESFG